MRTLALAVVAVAALTGTVTAGTVKADPVKAGAAETWLMKTLKWLGITSAPSPRAAGFVDTGSIWVVSVQEGTKTRWAEANGFGSPVFDAKGGAIFALQRDTVVRITAPDAVPEVVRKVDGVDKLIGFDPLVPADLIVLMRDEKAPIAVLSIARGSLTRRPFDPSVLDQQRILANMYGQERTIGPLRILVNKLEKDSLTGVIEWTDIFVEDGQGAARNLSRCDGVNCLQPAISPDRSRIAYIRSGG